MQLQVLIVPESEPPAPVAVRCPVCNLSLVLGKPAGRFRVKCSRRECHTTVEVISAAAAPYSSGASCARTSVEVPGHANSRRV